MPFQPLDLSGFTNYLLQQQRQQQPVDVMEEFKKGYGMAQMPEQMQRQREQEELANDFKREQLNQLQNPRVDELAENLKKQQLLALELKNDPNKKYSQFTEQIKTIPSYYDDFLVTINLPRTEMVRLFIEGID